MHFANRHEPAVERVRRCLVTAAQSLGTPSSAARALAAGAPYIERVDRLVQAIAAQKGMRAPVLDEVVRLVDARLEANRRSADAAAKPPELAKRTA